MSTSADRTGDRKALDRARETVRRIENASLATASPDGQPWNSPIFIAWSPGRTIYWASQRDSMHSHNIANRSSVCLVLFDSTAPDESGHGVYIRAAARELTDEASIQAALDCLAVRKKDTAKHASDFMGSKPRRVYEAIPSEAWTNIVKSEEGHYFDVRILVTLESLCGET